MKRDHRWLVPYAKVLEDQVILELGCGSGIDTTVLAGYAEHLVAGDLEVTFASPFASPFANLSDSQIFALVLDHSKQLPFKNASFDVVVASLCLHYFEMKKIIEIIAEISRVLKPQGSFICRLNSYQDENYGAVGYPQIEPGLYNVNGAQKRFFQEQEIRALWKQGYSLNAIAHKNIDRYNKSKWIYEFSAIRV